MSGVDRSDARSIRSRASSGKKFFKLTKEIQERIKGANESFNNPVELEKALQILETSKECYGKVINELNNLFLQDKWGGVGGSKANSGICRFKVSRGDGIENSRSVCQAETLSFPARKAIGNFQDGIKAVKSFYQVWSLESFIINRMSEGDC